MTVSYYKALEHIYIHWPFCPYKCHFCDFVALASHEEFMEQYHHALLGEMQEFPARLQEPVPVKTVYIGGGTPSTWPGDLLLDMSAKLENIITLAPDVEFTLEVNPGTVKPDVLPVWKKAGINRLSIGVQSLDDAVLARLNRHQKKVDVYALLDMASQYFENISVDFILGLPDVSIKDWKNYITQAMQWPITHISVYFLMVHEKTPLYYKVKTNKVSLPPDDETLEMYYWLVETLQKHGFEQYEISSFAKKGFRSKHNQAYWDRKPYKGFGLGSCSFTGTHRYQNTKNLGKYLDISRTDGVIAESEQLEHKHIQLEKIMLGLRQAKGMDIKNIFEHTTLQAQGALLKKIEELQSLNILHFDGEKVFLTPKGLALENEVAIQLFS